MDSRTPAFADEVLSLTRGEGVDVILNSLSACSSSAAWRSWRHTAASLSWGPRRTRRTRDCLVAVCARASFCAVGYLSSLPRLGLRFADIIARAEIGEFRPLPKRLFPLGEVASALSYLSRSRHIGKGGHRAARRSDEPCCCRARRSHQDLPAEGVELFELILAARRPHILVSKLPLEARLGRREGSDLASPRPEKGPASCQSTGRARKKKEPPRRPSPRGGEPRDSDPQARVASPADVAIRAQRSRSLSRPRATSLSARSPSSGPNTWA